MLNLLCFIKKNKRNKNIHKLLVIPIVSVLVVFVLFFVADEFWLLMQLFVLNNNKTGSSTTEYNPGANSYISGNRYDSGELNFTGYGGINLALLNKLNSGFVKDYLEIVRDHSNWKYVNEDIKRYTEYVPINAMIGMSQVEYSGIKVDYNGKSIVMPQTPLNYDEYNSIDGLNLYTVNSDWFNKYGIKYINRNAKNPTSMQWGDPSSDGGGAAHTTPYQFTLDNFAIVPDGVASPGNSGRYPSLLNTGYGFNKDRVRAKNETDAAYFPDVLSVLIQSAYSRLFTYADIDSLKNPEMAANMMHIGHHGQGTIFDISTGYNFNKVKLAANSPTTRNESFSSMLNMYSDCMQKIFDYFGANVDKGLEWNWSGRENYLGLGTGMYLYSYNAFFRNSNDRDIVLSKFSNNVDFNNGMKLGFEIASGKKFTDQEIKDWLSSSKCLRLDLEHQGYPAGGMRYGSGSKVYQYSLYIADDNAKVIYDGTGGKEVSVLHGWNQITTRMAFMGPLYGTYQIWEMLKVSGVDCKYSEVMNIQTNNLLDEIPSYVSGSGSVGEMIAEYAALMSWEDGNYDGRDWTTKEIAYATWGNSMYIKVHQQCNTKNPQYRCCDAFVNTAVLWSRADVTCIKQGVVRSCLPYFRNSEKWEEVAYFKGGTKNADISNMRPGDVVIGTSGSSGHIMLYVGEVVARVYPQYEDRVKKYDLAHASYSHSVGERIKNDGKGNLSRSSKLSSMTDNISGGGFSDIYVFRCVNPDNIDGQNILTSAEIAYLKANPFQTKEQYHPSYNSAGNEAASKINIRTK